MRTESVLEQLYPTEFSLLQITYLFDGKGQVVPMTSAGPIDFDVRNVGTSVEAVTMLEGDNHLNVAVSPEIVRYFDDRALGKSCESLPSRVLGR